MIEDSPFAQTSCLIRRAQAGDQDALNQVLARYQSRILARVRRLLGPLPRGLAESRDFVQDVFVDIVRAFDRFELRDEEAFLRWATEIARNNIRHAARRQRIRAMETLVTSLVVRRRPGEEPQPSPEGAASLNEQVAELESALAQLPEDYRQVIELREVERLSFGEIARQMGRSSEGAAQMLHARALARLSRMLARR